MNTASNNDLWSLLLLALAALVGIFFVVASWLYKKMDGDE